MGVAEEGNVVDEGEARYGSRANLYFIHMLFVHASQDYFIHDAIEEWGNGVSLWASTI